MHEVEATLSLAQRIEYGSEWLSILLDGANKAYLTSYGLHRRQDRAHQATKLHFIRYIYIPQLKSETVEIYPVESEEVIATGLVKSVNFRDAILRIRGDNVTENVKFGELVAEPELNRSRVEPLVRLATSHRPKH